MKTSEFMNDAWYETQSGSGITKWICPFYKVWASMKNRVCKLYSDVGICEEWLSFSSFRVWMETQPWEGRQLDKDILSGDVKIYSPNTCRFVPAWINTLVVKQENQRGKYPIGVHYRAGYPRPYVAQVRDGLGNKLHLGYHHTAEQAHSAYLIGKRAVIESAIKRWEASGLSDGDGDIINAIRKQ